MSTLQSAYRGVPSAEEAAGGQLVTARTRSKGTGQRLDGETDDHIPVEGGVRRLMPVECERLQSFPDGWTGIQWKGKPAADSRRYAAMGDAVTVNVAEWLGRRLMEHLQQEAP